MGRLIIRLQQHRKLFFLDAVRLFTLLPLTLFHFIATEAFYCIYIHLSIKNDAGKVTSKQMGSDRFSGVERYNIAQ